MIHTKHISWWLHTMMFQTSHVCKKNHVRTVGAAHRLSMYCFLGELIWCIWWCLCYLIYTGSNYSSDRIHLAQICIQNHIKCALDENCISLIRHNKRCKCKMNTLCPVMGLFSHPSSGGLSRFVLTPLVRIIFIVTCFRNHPINSRLIALSLDHPFQNHEGRPGSGLNKQEWKQRLRSTPVGDSIM